MIGKGIGSVALLCAAALGGMPAHATTGGAERPPERVHLVIALDPGAFFIPPPRSETEYGQWESTSAVQLAQYLENGLSETLAKRRPKRVIDVQQASARAVQKWAPSFCDGAPAVIRGRIEPIAGELRTTVTYRISSPRATRTYRWVSSSPYRPGIHRPQEPLGGALDGIDEQAAKLVEIFVEMIG